MSKQSSATLLIFMILQGCMLIGSKAVVLNKPAKNIKRMAVIVASVDQQETSLTAVENLVLTKTITESLARKNMFRFTVLERYYPIQTFTTLERSLLATELMDKYDAYLICVAVPNGPNYKVELLVVQTNPFTELVKVSHNTKSGNSYWWPQHSSEALVDAGEGVVDKLEMTWRKMEP